MFLLGKPFAQQLDAIKKEYEKTKARLKEKERERADLQKISIDTETKVLSIKFPTNM